MIWILKNTIFLKTLAQMVPSLKSTKMKRQSSATQTATTCGRAQMVTHVRPASRGLENRLDIVVFSNRSLVSYTRMSSIFSYAFFSELSPLTEWCPAERELFWRFIISIFFQLSRQENQQIALINLNSELVSLVPVAGVFRLAD